MSQKANPRRLADNEAKATVRLLRVSPQKLNLLAQLIRGKKVATALADLQFSNKRISVEVKKAHSRFGFVVGETPRIGFLGHSFKPS